MGLYHEVDYSPLYINLHEISLWNMKTLRAESQYLRESFFSLLSDNGRYDCAFDLNECSINSFLLMCILCFSDLYSSFYTHIVVFEFHNRRHVRVHEHFLRYILI